MISSVNGTNNKRTTGGITITLTLTSLSQVAAIENALDMLIDMEETREKDGKLAGWTAKDGIGLRAAREVAMILENAGGK